MCKVRETQLRWSSSLPEFRRKVSSSENNLMVWLYSANVQTEHQHSKSNSLFSVPSLVRKDL